MAGAPLGVAVGLVLSWTLVAQGALAPGLLVLTGREIGVGPYLFVWGVKGIIVAWLVDRGAERLDVAALRAIRVGTLAGFVWWLVPSLTLARLVVGGSPSWSPEAVSGAFPHLVAVLIGFPAVGVLWTTLRAGPAHDPDRSTTASGPPDIASALASGLALALGVWCAGPLTVAPLVGGRPIAWSVEAAVPLVPALLFLLVVGVCAAIAAWAVLRFGQHRARTG